MNKSESITKLAAALVAAQPQIEGAKKDKDNPFFKSKYADLSSVMKALESIAPLGLSYIQVSHDRDNAAAIETIILHSSGEWLSCGIVSVPVSKHDAQGFGSALTYARRYSLSAAFGVSAEDDDGNAAAAAKPKKTELGSGPKITPSSGMWESQTVDMQNHLMDIVHNVRTLMKKNDDAGAWDELVSHDVDLDEIQKVALWSRFDSKERSALKRESERRKENPPRGANAEERAAA